MQGIPSNAGDYTPQSGIFTLGPDACVLSLDAAAEQLLGTGAAELLGRSLLERFASAASRSRAGRAPGLPRRSTVPSAGARRE